MKLTYLSTLLGACALATASAHDHFAAAVVDVNNNNQPDAGEPLRLDGPALTGRIFHLLARPVGYRPIQRCGGFYMLGESARTLFPLDAFSLTALSDGQEIFPAEAGHAHTGAYIWVEITAVTGPPGGSFGFWDKGQSLNADVPTVSFATNQPTENHAFVVSGGADAVDQDPHGHIHGREWTADKPGDYRVSFRFVDRSTTGPGGGPWHPPSEVFTFHFRAGPDFQPAMVKGPSGVTLTWPSQMGTWDDSEQPGVEFKILRSTTLAGAWEEIGSVTGTTAATATFTDGTPPQGKAFYRIAYAWGKQPETVE